MKTAISELNNFRAWTKIKHCIDYGGTVSVLKDWEHLSSTLESGLMEEVSHHPDYTKHIRNPSPEFINQYVWLRPTRMGLMCYELWSLLQEQKCKTKEAYQKGKYDAVLTLCEKMYKLTDVDQSDFEGNDD